jgi:hypothetical protein
MLEADGGFEGDVGAEIERRVRRNIRGFGSDSPYSNKFSAVLGHVSLGI